MQNPDNHHVRKEPYVHQPFPSIRYHRDGSTRVIQTQEEHDELDAHPDWSDTPAAFEEGGAKFATAAPAEPEAEPAKPEKKKAAKKAE